MDWSSTPDGQSILAVGFLRHIEILCQQRMTYFDEGPGWAVCCKVDISEYVLVPTRTLLTDLLSIHTKDRAISNQRLCLARKWFFGRCHWASNAYIW
jgi:RAVE protein 1 C terminal